MMFFLSLSLGHLPWPVIFRLRDLKTGKGSGPLPWKRSAPGWMKSFENRILVCRRNRRFLQAAALNQAAGSGAPKRPDRFNYPGAMHSTYAADAACEEVMSVIRSHGALSFLPDPFRRCFRNHIPIILVCQ